MVACQDAGQPIISPNRVKATLQEENDLRLGVCGLVRRLCLAGTSSYNKIHDRLFSCTITIMKLAGGCDISAAGNNLQSIIRQFFACGAVC